MPRLIIVAGVNGSGKSTLTQQNRFNNVRIIDPDQIAKDTSNTKSQSARLSAARVAINRRNTFLNNRDSFIVETTLSGRDILRFMQKARDQSYRVELHYVFLIDANQSADRVATRVSRGGHDIPLADIKRRFPRSRANFIPAAKLCDLVVAYDNASYDLPFEPVLSIEDVVVEIDKNAAQWLHDALNAIITPSA